MIVAATSDIHSPRYIRLFIDSVRSSPPPDMLLLAGDLVLRGAAGAFQLVHENVRKYWGGLPVVATFGNEEFETTRKKLRRDYPDVIWLEDEMVEVKGIPIFGTPGVLDEPTLWQKNHVANVEQIYARRLRLIRETLSSAKSRTVLLTHYAVGSFTTDVAVRLLQLTSVRLFEQIRDYNVVVIHGHSHFAPNWKHSEAQIDICNVALPLHKKIVLLNL
ncbi:metallophosphoesterase [Coprothermobacteraceae bacterium]|nr:metallophosphoesterase [Coprothermobacteraceae bacterium]